MLSAEQIAAYDRDGFVKGQTILNDAQVEILRQELDRVIRDQDKPTPQPVLLRNLGEEQAPLWQIVNIWEASHPFQELLYCPPLLKQAAQLSRAGQLRVWHDQIQYKPAQKGGVNMWHQDGPYWPILQPKSQLTAWVALDDVDPSNGCMSMIPGSHLWDDQIEFLHTLKHFADMPAQHLGHRLEIRPCPVRKGQVHFHHSLTWHGSPGNSSNRPRRAIAIHYMAQETRYDASGDHPMKAFVTVSDGAAIQGDHFPLVWDGQALPAPT